MYYIYRYCYFITAGRHRHIIVVVDVVDGLIIYTTVVGTDIDDLYSKKNEPNPDRTTMRFLQILYTLYRYVYNIKEWSERRRRRRPLREKI